MRRMTLLEIVQDVSREIGDKERLGLDEDLRVNDIANICIATIEGICTRHQWEFLRDRMLVPTVVTDKVTISLPTNVVRVSEVKYRINANQAEICYLLPEEFLRLVDTDADYTEPVAVPGGGVVYVKNSGEPRYYTSFDEESITFDAYNTTSDPTGIQASKVLMRADIELDTSGAREVGLPVEGWIPDIPARLFSLWLWECVVKCYNSIVRQVNEDAAREARRQYVMALENEPKTQRDESKRRVTFGRRYSY